MTKRVALLEEEQVDRLVEVWFVALNERNEGEDIDDVDVELLEKFESMRRDD